MSLYDRDYMQPAFKPAGLRGFRWDAFKVVFWLNIAVFVLQYVLGIGMERVTVTGPSGRVLGEYFLPMGRVSLELLSSGHVWTPFTYMFVHGSLGHMLVNTVMLWFVGRQVHQIFGGAHFLRIYILSGLAGAAFEIAVRAWTGQPDVTVVGASAAVFGLFLALAVTMPGEVITALLYFIIPVKARLWTLAMWLVGINLVLGVGGLVWSGMPGAGVAYFAHLAGALTGWYYVRLLGYGGHPLTYRRLWEPRAPEGGPREEGLAPLVARKRRRDLPLEMDQEAVAREARRDPRDRLIQDEVDPILDKISAEGMHSLTEDERRILERASRLVRKPPSS